MEQGGRYSIIMEYSSDAYGKRHYGDCTKEYKTPIFIMMW